MRATTVMGPGSPRRAWGGGAGIIFGLALAGLPSCKTTEPKEEIVVMVDTAPPPTVPREVDAPGGAPAAAPGPVIPPPVASPLLSERLEPVRGGAQMLPPYRGPHPCRMALTGASPVAKACSQGGTRRAVEMMQTFVKRARGEGFVFQCADCHLDEDDYSKLAPDADSRFRELLFLARPND